MMLDADQRLFQVNGRLLVAFLLLAFGNAVADSAELTMPRLYPEGEYTVRKLQRGMPEIGAAPGVTMQTVADNMTNNGLPMQVHQFKSERPVEEVVELYKARFEQLGMFAPQSDMNRGFATLYGGLGPYFVRMQMASKDGETAGYLTIMAQPGTVETERDSAFPLPASVTVESRMQFGDDGAAAETLIAHSDDFPGTVLDDLDRTLNAEGWNHANPDSGTTMRDGGAVRYTRGDGRAEIFVSTARDAPYRSAVVVNWRK
ncbi:MAG: hypothetical protein FKY71_06500 [Spiribacter salinus]|uniref:Uncharacterized protein n=1 Tax=Spiribacter salinus TaxID=1335746 RepID=A0A540VSY1_9GAMM|nr:MAG: hypothetical protein FKY71_06500 [Spiribacter salinus]